MKKSEAIPIIDGRHLKILAAKKESLKNCFVIIRLNEEKYGHLDVGNLRAVAEHLEQIEPDAVYFCSVKDLDLEFYDKSQFRNKDLLITIGHEGEDTDEAAVEKLFEQALPEARSIEFVHQPARIVIKEKRK
jgi:hypothetical protein